jgi:hypothetical protein
MVALTLTHDELIELTGYRLATRQLAELKRQGFYRARRSPVTGRVILERGHYDAIIQAGTAKPAAAGPKLHLVAQR